VRVVSQSFAMATREEETRTWISGGTLN